MGDVAASLAHFNKVELRNVIVLGMGVRVVDPTRAMRSSGPTRPEIRPKEIPFTSRLLPSF